MLATHSNVAGGRTLRATPADAVSLWNQVLQPIESFLPQLADKIADQASAFEVELVDYARYALASQGKQIRPTLVALSGGACGPLQPDHLTIASIIEMIHLATLVHDDVMDGARVRRRRPTLAANWGVGLSVLVGDCLFSHALELAAEFPNPQICRSIARAAKRVCSGEILQNQNRGNLSLTRSEYLRVIEMKTAELFALSCEMGGIFSQAPAETTEALRHYGMALGSAYQIYDDCLDLFGSESAAGKSLGTDLTKGKITLPILVALERSSQEERATLESMLENWSPASMERLQHTLTEFDCLEESRSAARQLLDGARARLAVLAAGPHTRSLNVLLDYVDLQIHSLGVA